MAQPDFPVTAIDLNYYSDMWGPFTFNFPVESAVGKADGVLPFGDSVTSVSVKAYLGKVSRTSDLASETDITTDIVDPSYAPIVGPDSVKVRFQYPPSTYKGKKATVVFEITTTNGAKTAFFFHYLRIN